MAVNKDISLNFKAKVEGDLSNIKSQIKELKTQLGNFQIPKTKTEKLEGAIRRINAEIQEFETHANQGIENLADVQRIQTNWRHIDAVLGRIKIELANVFDDDSISIYFKKTQENMAEARQELEKYAQLVQRIDQSETVKAKRSAIGDQNAAVKSLQKRIAEKKATVEARQLNFDHESEQWNKNASAYQAELSAHERITQELQKQLDLKDKAEEALEYQGSKVFADKPLQNQKSLKDLFDMVQQLEGVLQRIDIEADQNQINELKKALPKAKGKATRATNKVANYKKVKGLDLEKDDAYQALVAKAEEAVEERDDLQKKVDGAFAKLASDQTMKPLAEQQLGKSQQLINDLKTAQEEYKAAQEAVAKLSAEKKESDNRVIPLANQKKAYETSQGDLEKSQRELAGLVDQSEKAKQKIEQLKQELENLRLTETEDKWQQLVKRIKELTGLDVSSMRDQFKEILAVIDEVPEGEVAQVSEAIHTMREGFSSAEKPVRNFRTAIGETSAELKELSQSEKDVERLKYQVIEFFSIGNTINIFKRALRSAFDTIKELDKAMTETAVVTDFSIEDMWAQLPKYTKVANELGATTLGAYETATLFYQQGLKTNEALELSTETMKMARIAGLDYTNATNLMTAALRGFNMELSTTSAQRVNDVYSQLAAITAADTQEIAHAMTKTASIANSANMEFETTAAFLAQIIETTRESAETAGTAMKTVIARFQELKKSPSEIGEVDGEVVDANKIEGALRSINVALRDSKGQFRDLDDVFLEVAGKWETLDRNTQRYIATIAAGSRQQSRFIAMMSDYGRTMELVDAANNSAGAGQKQYEKTLTSLESKLNKLKNAWDQFTMGLANSDFIKLGVDTLTLLLKIVNALTELLPGLNGNFAKLAVTVGGIKLSGAFFSTVFDSLKKSASEGGATAGEGFYKGFQKNLKDRFGGVSNYLKNFVPFSDGKELQKATKIAEKEQQKLAVIQEQLEAKKRDSSEKLLELEAERNRLAEQRQKGNLGKSTVSSKPTERQRRNQRQIDELSQPIKELTEQERIQSEVTQQAVRNRDKLAESLKDTNIAYRQQCALMGKVAASAGLAGAALSLLAAQQEKIGNTDNAAALRAIANGLTVISGILLILPGILKAVGIESLKVQAAWGWVAIIGVALVSLGVAISKWYKDDEERLAELTEKAEAAKESLAKAKEQLENLGETRSSYDRIIDEMDSLIEGTDAWTKKLYEANELILELISNSPGLRDLVKEDKNGLLTMDWEEASRRQKERVQRENVVYSSKQDAVTREKINQKQDNLDDDLAELYRTFGGDSNVVKQKRAQAEREISAMQNELIGNEAKTLMSRVRGSEVYNEFSDSLTTGFVKAMDETRKDETKALAKSLKRDKSKKELANMYAEALHIDFSEIDETLANDEKELAARLAAIQKDDDYTKKFMEIANDLTVRSKDYQKNFSALVSEDASKLTGAEIENLSISDYVDDAQKFDIDAESLEATKKKMMETYKNASEELTSQNVSSELFEDFSLSTIRGLSSQTRVIGRESAQEYVAAFNKVMSKATGPTELRKGLENSLSTIDWTDMSQAIKAFDYMFENNLDQRTMEEFWTAATEGTNLFVKSLDEALNLLDQITGKIGGMSEIKEHLVEGKGTSEDLQKLIAAGVDISGFQLTAEGWKATSEQIEGATKKLGEYYALQGRSMQQAHAQTYHQAVLDFQEGKGFGSITELDEVNGPIKAGEVQELGIQGAEDITRLDRDSYLDEDAFWAAVEQEYQEYLNLLKDGQAILQMNEKTAAFAEASQYSSAELERRPGTSDQSALWALQNEASAAGIDYEEIQAYASALQDAHSELDELNASQIAFHNILMNKGFMELSEFYEDFDTIIDTATGKLKDHSSETMASFENIKKVVSKMLNLTEDLSNGFWENAENLKNIEKVASGDTDAIEELQKAAAQDYIANIELQVSTDDAQKALSDLSDLVGNYDFPKLELGEALDDTSFLSKCNKLIADANLTAEQISQAYKAMGFDVEIQYVKSERLMPNPIQKTKWHLGKDGLTSTTTTEMGEPTKVEGWFPSVKTITSAGTGGGGISTGNIKEVKANAEKANKKSGKAPKDDSWDNSYDKFYNVVRQINEELREREKIERRYQKLLKNEDISANKLLEASKKELTQLARAKSLKQQLLQQRKQELSSIEAENQDKQMYAKIVTNEFGDQTIRINWDQLNAIQHQDRGKDVDEYIKKLEEQLDSITELEDSLNEIDDSIEEIQERGKDEYFDLENKIKDSLVNFYQEEIDKLSAINDSINDTNSKLLDAMRKNLDKVRQDRQNEKVQEELSGKEQQLLYLQSDTSGANDLEILKLQQEIDDGRQDYTDSLIDQKLTELQDQNDQAADQRQRQIDIMQGQLDFAVKYGQIWDEVQQLMAEGLDKDTGLVRGSRLEALLMSSEGFYGMSQLGQMEWLKDIQSQIAQSLLYLDNIEEGSMQVPVVNVTVDNGGYSSQVQHDFYDVPNNSSNNDSGWESDYEETTPQVEESRPQIRGYYIDTPAGRFEGPTPYDVLNTAMTQLSKYYKEQQAEIEARYDQERKEIDGDNSHSGSFKLESIKQLNQAEENELYWLKEERKKEMGALNVSKVKAFKAGGLANFTGPAWLDGTKSNPEMVLNAKDTKNFIQLKDILKTLLGNGKVGSTENHGDSYYDIDINVESIENDYDVDKIAERIKTLIGDSARYRNNNTVNLMR